MPTPNNAPYKVEQRDLAKRANSVRWSEEWYRLHGNSGFGHTKQTKRKKRKIAQYKKR